MKMPKQIKKFTRSRKLVPNIRLQPRDIEILKDLADYRFLDSSQIMALHPAGESPRYIQYRLQNLFHHGFVDRPPAQVSFYRNRNHLIYSLGPQGAALLGQDNPDIRARLNWQTKNPALWFPFLSHAMMISDFRVALLLALKKTPQAKLVSWRQGKELKDRVFVSGQKLSVAPDGFFTIEDKNELLNFFIEADRSTMPLERFFKKIAAYWQWKREGGHKKLLGINNFRVLTFTISEERKNNLRTISQQADIKKEWSPMFWFSCEKNYSFADPESVLSPIWQTPKDDARHFLLE